MSQRTGAISADPRREETQTGQEQDKKIGR